MRLTNSCRKDSGRRARMPIMMINEVPFPRPRSVIRSPSHITKSVLQVRMITLTGNHKASFTGRALAST